MVQRTPLGLKLFLMPHPAILPVKKPEPPRNQRPQVLAPSVPELRTSTHPTHIPASVPAPAPMAAAAERGPKEGDKDRREDQENSLSPPHTRAQSARQTESTIVTLPLQVTNTSLTCLSPPVTHIIGIYKTLILGETFYLD